MKVVGLLSGGKDSCYNLCHCAKNGHQVVALASLGPEAGKDELDSYLYQTVGQDGIHLVAEALALPLYRCTIQGKALELRSEYGSRTHESIMKGVEGDETEDMYNLLYQVKSLHPEIMAVSVGAILSTYQRVRVEYVCQRLGLTPLAFLWHRDQAELLNEMVNASVEAVLIKVASVGLMPDHLGKTLKEVEPTLRILNSKYGVHVCGEGGEYETFTLDCPLFKSRISLKKVQVTHHPESSPMAPVAYLRLLSAELIPSSSPVRDLDRVVIPPLLDPESVRAIDEVESLQTCVDGIEPILEGRCDFNHFQPVCIAEHFDWVMVSSIVGSKSSSSHDSSHSQKTLIDQANEAFACLEESLFQKSLSLMDIAHINLYLSSMADFMEVNDIYATKFGTSPPTRACVSANLGSGIRLMIEAIARRPNRIRIQQDRLALHVQSRSYWAPANIGPYSQAVMVGGRIFVAGQIGLIPASLTLPSPPSFLQEAVLSLQHARRILATFSPTQSIEGVICYMTDISYVEQARMIWEHSPSIYDEKIPILFLEVTGLPKGAMIEWQVVAQTDFPSDGESQAEEFRVEYINGKAPAFKGSTFPTSKALTVVGTIEDESTFALPPHHPTCIRAFCTPCVSPTKAREALFKALDLSNHGQVAWSLVSVNAIALGHGAPDVEIGFYMMGSLL